MQDVLGKGKFWLNEMYGVSDKAKAQRYTEQTERSDEKCLESRVLRA